MYFETMNGACNDSQNNTCQLEDVDKHIGIATVSSYIWMITAPLLVIFGVTGNVLAFLVLRKLGICRHPTLTFLAFLAVNDTIVLLIGLPTNWIINVFNYDIRLASDIHCNLYFFFIYFSMQYSSWILAGVAIERLAKTYFPFRYKHVYTSRKVTVGLLVALFVLVAVNIHFFFTNGINADSNCDSLEAHEHFNEKVFIYIDFSLLCAAPFTIMLVSNILLVRILRTEQKRRASVVHHSVVAAANRFSARMTKILIVCTIYFGLATAPASVYLIVDSYVKATDETGKTAKDIVKTVLFLLQYSNHCINFYLYAAINDRFRKEVDKMLCCRTGFRLSFLQSTRDGSSSASASSQTVNSISTGTEKSFLSEGYRPLKLTVY